MYVLPDLTHQFLVKMILHIISLALSPDYFQLGALIKLIIIGIGMVDSFITKNCPKGKSF